jgi:hypothetical protein
MRTTYTSPPTRVNTSQSRASHATLRALGLTEHALRKPAILPEGTRTSTKTQKKEPPIRLLSLTTATLCYLVQLASDAGLGSRQLKSCAHVERQDTGPSAMWGRSQRLLCLRSTTDLMTRRQRPHQSLLAEPPIHETQIPIARPRLNVKSLDQLLQQLLIRFANVRPSSSMLERSRGDIISSQRKTKTRTGTVQQE